MQLSKTLLKQFLSAIIKVLLSLAFNIFEYFVLNLNFHINDIVLQLLCHTRMQAT